MALYYCDHGAYATALGAAPTWGVPQEGDGSATTAASASSVAAIVLTANAAATNTFTVCGVVFTAVASGATGNQFNVGAALTNTIDNLVAAINASTTAVGTGVAPGAPQLRNLVFARNTSGTTVEIMMRVGSATLNGASNTNCRLSVSGWSTSTSLPVDFAGGSGGCWGLLFNTTAMGVSNSYAALAYGLMVLATPICAASSAAVSTIAVPGDNDLIYCRTGAGFTLTLAANATPALGTPSYRQHLVFDSNTVWTGDSGTGVITISLSISGTDVNLRLAANVSGVRKSIRCLYNGGLRFLWASSNGSGSPYILPSSSSGGRSPVVIEGVTFETPTTFNTGSNPVRFVPSVTMATFKSCNFLYKEARTTLAGFISPGNTLDGMLELDGCRVEYNHTAGGDPGPIVAGLTLGSGSAIRFIGVRFSGWAFGRYRVFPTMTMGAGSEAIARGCTGINMGATYVGISADRADNYNYATVIHQSLDAGLAYRYEYAAGVVDWNPDASPAYPTRSALLGDNTTPWSVKVDWFAATVNVANRLMTPQMATICRLAAGVRTVALDFMAPIALTATDVAMRVQYVSTDNRVYTESSWGVAAALSAPGASWTGSGSYPSHTSRRLSLTTANAVKEGTEVAVVFEATGAPPGGTGVQLYVDPEFALT